MIKSGLYSVVALSESGDILTIGNFTVVNTVDDDYDIVVGGDGTTRWNGYARAGFGMTTVEIAVSRAPFVGLSGIVLFDTASADIDGSKIEDLNDGYQIEVHGYGRRKEHDGIALVDTPVVFTIVREFDIETVV